MRSTSSSRRWRWSFPGRIQYSRSWVPRISLIWLSGSPLEPRMTILSMVIRRPSLMLKTTFTSPSANFSTSGVIWTSK